MPSIPRQLITFFAVLAVLYTGGFVAGQFIDTGSHASEDMEMGEEHGGAAEHAAEPAQPVRGLAVAAGGLRLALDTPELERGRTAPLRFRIVGSGGRPVRDFDVSHERRMHLIVVRRDLTGFQHLHPEMAADGTWSTRVELPDAGTYRVYADFARDGEPHTLAADLRVDGAADLRPLPAAADTARTGGYEVRLAPDALRFEITRDGEPVRTQPYLGAAGHLVALREGDLAFLHVHPESDDVAFEATFPTPGRYRLFLQFRHEGRVHTAAFTRDVAP